jgi:hypothetical protein
MNSRLLQHSSRLVLVLGSLWLVACTTQPTPNEANYMVCQALVEKDRAAARKSRFYSYKPRKFDACRAPYRFTLE